MYEFITGVIMMGYWVAGLFFLRYWHETRDRLFAFFCAAFWLLAIQRLMLVLTAEIVEDVAYIYLIRLLAFVLILIAIVDKNRVR
ncbi:MAG: hypothetical protein H0T73_15375 [Ardenticatenales bacterium]|nr:hypothetical protein [Ardenticatenales bacterium]